MIEVLKVSDGTLEVLDEPTPNCWINVASPTNEELLRVKSFIEIPEELLTSLKDIDEIPTIEAHERFTFTIIRAPYNNLKNELEYYSVPLGIFITKDMMLTICYYDNDTIPKLKTQKLPSEKTQMLFKLLLVSARLYLTYLNEINHKMYFLENQLEKTQKNKVIMHLLEIEKSLVYFSTSLKANEILVERISKEGFLVTTEEDKKLVSKVMDENKQAIEMTNTYSNILSNTLDAFASVISNNLNLFMKILASITIVLSLPTLVASIYGMNINLPFQHSPHAFAIVMLFSFGVSALALLVLWKKNFF